MEISFSIVFLFEAECLNIFVLICRGEPIPSRLMEKVGEYIPEDINEFLRIFEVNICDR